MQLTQEQQDELKREVRRTFYAATLLRKSGDKVAHLRRVALYCETMRDDYDVMPIAAMSFLAGAGMDATIDILGDEADEDLTNALYELELDGE
jgi:hypothetical protein